jgi:hypothetical protein
MEYKNNTNENTNSVININIYCITNSETGNKRTINLFPIIRKIISC